MLRTSQATGLTKAQMLLMVISRGFAGYIAGAAGEEGTWQSCLDSLRRNGLLAVTVANPIAPEPLEVDQECLGDPIYRKKLIRRLRKRHPHHVQLHLNIDRARVDDQEYLNSVSEYAAANWLLRLAPVESSYDYALLLRLDANLIARCLSELHLIDQTPSRCARLVLGSYSRALADHPGLKSVIGDFDESVEQITRLAIADLELRLTEIFTNERARFDDLVTEIESCFEECGATLLSTLEKGGKALSALRESLVGMPSVEESFDTVMLDYGRGVRRFRYADNR